MSREVRMVPKGWQHPKQRDGRFIPLLEGYKAAIAEWEEGARMWEHHGMCRDFVDGGWAKISGDIFADSYEEWAGARPVASDYMPDWSEEEKTHYMMYESTSEGTPKSPAFKYPEGLARWLAETRASAFAGNGASYEHWLAMIRKGHAPSAMIFGGEIVSGVSGIAELKGTINKG